MVWLPIAANGYNNNIIDYQNQNVGSGVADPIPESLGHFEKKMAERDWVSNARLGSIIYDQNGRHWTGNIHLCPPGTLSNFVFCFHVLLAMFSHG